MLVVPGGHSCSVVIVTYNTRELTLCCLESLFAALPPLNIQLVVVDNASSDGTADAIVKQFPQAKMLANTSNLGFARAANQGIAKATESIILLLNPDTRVNADTLHKLLEVFAANPRVGAAGPLILSHDGSVQHHCAAQQLSVPGQLAWHFRLPLAYNRLHLEGSCGPHGARRTQRLSGAAFAVRRSVLKQVGLLDERFFMYFEDADLSLRIREMGHELACVTEATIIHAQGASSCQNLRARSEQALRSELGYFAKHATPLASLLLRIGLGVKASARALSIDLIRAVRRRDIGYLANDLRVLRRCLFK